MNKLASMLSLTKKAGKLILGFDVAKEAVEKKNAGLVLLAKDLSPKSRKEIALVCEKSGAQMKELPLTMDEIWFAAGKRAGILAVADEGLAKKLAQLTDDANKEESTL
ncbi:MAG: ribosomal L7Ae/L30e/S12e/Gadd45 family protein [Oscillospiraceae bacterium]|nr:ribosomal L7Ae/L30e/S12e/Gadd45 family protein [Oscillospiraceae bacterium]